MLCHLTYSLEVSFFRKKCQSVSQSISHKDNSVVQCLLNTHQFLKYAHFTQKYYFLKPMHFISWSVCQQQLQESKTTKYVRLNAMLVNTCRKSVISAVRPSTAVEHMPSAKPSNILLYSFLQQYYSLIVYTFVGCNSFSMTCQHKCY